jgi:hypothetical protein
MEPEKDNGPGQIKGKLNEKHHEGGPDPEGRGSLFPDNKERDPHKNVEDGPYRGKYPWRRVEDRFDKGGIPLYN